MKSNMKKKRKSQIKNTTLVFLILILFNPVVSLLIDPMTNITSESHESIIEKRNTYTKQIIRTATTFNSATRNITIGTGDKPFNDSDIINEDTYHDSVSFATGSIGSRATQLPTMVYDYRGVVGTTDSVSIPFALLNHDAYSLWVGGTFPIHYPEIIFITFGGFGNFEEQTHEDLTSIRIDYGILPDFYWPTGNTFYLQLIAIADNLEVEPLMLATNPVDGHYYTGLWYITSGAVFDRVKNGGYVLALKAAMNCWLENSPHVWININYIRITYEFQMYDLDLFYDIAYTGYGLDNAERFNITINVNDTMKDINVELYDNDNETWQSTGKVITTAGRLKIQITENGQRFFGANDRIHIRFVKLNHYSERPSNEYKLKIDYIEVEVQLPDPPDVSLTQHIMRISLNWEEPEDFGVPITHYNVYRGITLGGNKSLIGSPSTEEYDDTLGIITDTDYYYVVSAVSSIGEGQNSTEVSGQAYNQPFVDWLSPADNKSVVFSYNSSDEFDEWRIFYFDYDHGYLDNVILNINGTDYGSVWNTNSCRINPFLKGTVNATLVGYNSSIKVAEQSRVFEFILIEFEKEVMLHTNLTFLGQQLYLILHDPNGDLSYSHFTETSTFSLGVGYSITNEAKNVLGIDGIVRLPFVGGVGASQEFTNQETKEEGFQFRFELSDTTGLTSNKGGSNPDYIGPGHGDLYWGEAWFYRHQLNATLRHYSNGSEGYESPKLFYGLERDAEVLLNDINAPAEWKSQNPVHDNYANVTWIPPIFGAYGDFDYSKTWGVSNTIGRSKSFTIHAGSHTFLDGGVIEDTIEISQTIKSYAEVESGHTLETGYYISDDDPTDFLAMEIGLDQRFGTYIFKTLSYECQTSNPLEHNTFDYIPPQIEFPDIDYDSNSDGVSPCPDDTPKVTVEISDEGDISEALIFYSINNGSTWDIIYLNEQPGNLGTYDCYLRTQPENTTVLWYVKAWDATGSNATRFDVTALPFEYRVIAKPSETPVTPLPEIPGYSPVIMVLLICTMFTGIVFAIKRKNLK